MWERSWSRVKAPGRVICHSEWRWFQSFLSPSFPSLILSFLGDRLLILILSSLALSDACETFWVSVRHGLLSSMESYLTFCSILCLYICTHKKTKMFKVVSNLVTHRFLLIYFCFCTLSGHTLSVAWHLQLCTRLSLITNPHHSTSPHETIQISKTSVPSLAEHRLSVSRVRTLCPPWMSYLWKVNHTIVLLKHIL